MRARSTAQVRRGNLCASIPLPLLSRQSPNHLTGGNPMKKLIFSACALTLTCGTAVANNSDWDQLDNDVQALSANLQDMEGGGMTIGGRIRTFYASSSDQQVATTAGSNDLGGFQLYNARLFATGTTAAGVGYRFENDFATGNLLDAYIDVGFGDAIDARMGQFRGFVLAESQIDSGNLFFADRSVNAASFAGRQQGLAIRGDMEAFNWAITIQDGSDGTLGVPGAVNGDGDDLFYAVHAGMNFMGEGTSMIEGAYGAGDEMTASAGISYYDDGGATDGGGFAIEASAQSSQFSLSANMVSRDDSGVGSNFDTNESHIMLTRGEYTAAAVEGDNSPWSLMGTFALNESWELGIRYQDLDDTNSTDVMDIGANYYVDGHAMKYIFNWTSVGSDSAAGDTDLIRLGFNAAF